MFEVNIKIISELKAFLSSSASESSLLALMRNSDKAFTRNRKLTFCRTVLLICKLCKKTLSVELDQFFEKDLGLGYSCSVSALSLQRKKLAFWFFSFWNDVLCASFYFHGKQHGEVRTWRGHRLIAVDGSKMSLIAVKALQKAFGGQSNRHSSFCGAQAIVQFDVLNELFIYSRLAPYRTAELNMAWEAIDNLETDMIAIYDRNFSNFKTIALHLYSEQQPRFVIRAKEHMRMVKTFLKTGLQSQELDMYPGKSGIDGMRKAGFIVNKRTALRVRMIRVELNNGITEVLFTNLWEAEGYESALFQELYMKRWGIETCIGISKNLLQLESMSGLSEESVYQDFYATIFMTNLASLLGRQGTDEVQKKHLESSKKYKWEVKVNMNKGSGELRRRLTELFLNDDPPRIIQNLVDYFCRHVSPIRPGRSYKRKRINKLFNCKHRTYSNYKPST